MVLRVKINLSKETFRPETDSMLLCEDNNKKATTISTRLYVTKDAIKNLHQIDNLRPKALVEIAAARAGTEAARAGIAAAQAQIATTPAHSWLSCR